MVMGPVATARRVLKLRLEERPPIWRVAANILNKQSWTADKGWSSSLGVGRGANSSSPKKKTGVVMIHKEEPRAWANPLIRSKQWKTDMKFGAWNVRSMYKGSSGSGMWGYGLDRSGSR